MDYLTLGLFGTLGLISTALLFANKSKKEEVAKQQRLLLSINILGVSKKVASELRLDKEKKILEISQAIMSSLCHKRHEKEEGNTQEVYEFTLKILEGVNVDPTPKRKQLIRDLLATTLKI